MVTAAFSRTARCGATAKVFTAWVLLSIAPDAFAGKCDVIQTEETLGMGNGLVSLAFDKQTGALVSMKNVASGDEYLKSLQGEGNPFRAYVDTTQLPRLLRYGFPFPVKPTDDALGGALIQPNGCIVERSSFRRIYGGGRVQWVLRHVETGLLFDFKACLYDDDFRVRVELSVKNTGTKKHSIMTAFPYLSGLALGPEGRTNLAVRLVEFGQSQGLAWQNSGDVYGRGWGGQWEAVYEPSLNEGLGLMVPDRSLQEKMFQRHPGGIMSVLYFINQELAPGQTKDYPYAELLVHTGNWKVTAHRYGEWFRSAFPLRQQPQWLDDVGMFVGSWIPSPEAVAQARKRPEEARPFASFAQLPRISIGTSHDLRELAQYWQGVIRHDVFAAYNHADGLYDFREDLGGGTALNEGVARSVKLGRYVGLYVASRTVRKDSLFFQPPNPGAGQRCEDWMLMEKPDVKENGKPSVSMCLRYGPWQDHVAATCKRLLRETGARYIRLDELASTYEVCHNPAHRHADPFVATREMLDFVRKVRAAMDAVDPESVLFTEGATDLLALSCNGTLAMWAPGVDIAPMRLVLPDFVGLAYHLGQVDCALNGHVCKSGAAANSSSAWWNPHHGGIWSPGLEHMPKRYPVQPPAQAQSPNLRWDELGQTFVAAARHGVPADVNPVGMGQEPGQWAGRLWKSENYWLLVCGDRAACRTNTPVRVKLPELPGDVTQAIEFDMETLAMRDACLHRGQEDITVITQAGFSAVLLPRAACPPLIEVSDIPALGKGESRSFKLRAIAPWRSSGTLVKVHVNALGLDVLPRNMKLPVTRTLSDPDTPGEGESADGRMQDITPTLCCPAEAEPGLYKLEVAGNCLPLKRWIKVQ